MMVSRRLVRRDLRVAAASSKQRSSAWRASAWVLETKLHRSRLSSSVQSRPAQRVEKNGWAFGSEEPPCSCRCKLASWHEVRDFLVASSLRRASARSRKAGGAAA